MKLSPELRAQALKSLMFTPERESMISSLSPKLEEMVSHPSVRRAYVMGSTTTNKPIPGDLDIVTLHDAINKQKGSYNLDFLDYFDKYNKETLPTNLHNVRRGGAGNDITKSLMEVGKKRYGETGEKPNRFLDPSKPWVRIAGLGTGLGLASTLSPDQSEAFEVKKASPLTKEIASLVGKPFSISSAAEALKGKFIQGLEILDVVTKGKGEERFVLLKNPETQQTFQWPIDKEALATLSSVKGYETYMEKFKALGSQDPIGKAEQAFKSMDTRIEKGLTGTLKDIKPWTESYLSKAHALSPLEESNLEEMPDLVYVRWKNQTMHLPRWYADFLSYQKQKPANKYISSELEDFKLLKTEPKYHTTFAQKQGEFSPGKTYQYGILKNDEISFAEGTGEELLYWFSSTGVKKQKESGIKILTLSDLQDYIEKLGGIV